MLRIEEFQIEQEKNTLIMYLVDVKDYTIKFSVWLPSML